MDNPIYSHEFRIKKKNKMYFLLAKLKYIVSSSIQIMKINHNFNKTFSFECIKLSKYT